jgi:hypothetical protein
MSFCPWCGAPLRSIKSGAPNLKPGEHRRLSVLVLVLGISLTATVTSVAALSLLILAHSHSTAPEESLPANQREGATSGADARRILFLRPETATSAFGRDYGALFTANSDGSNVTELAPGEEASFVGFGQDGANALLYYIARTPSGNYLLRKRNLATNEVFDLSRIEAPDKTDAPPIGSLSADKRHIAFAHADGIDVQDLTTGEIRRLLTNDVTGCDVTPPDFKRCYAFFSPRWSPDGRWLLASKTFYEGGRDVIVGPSGLFAQPVTLGGSGASWSPASDAVCYNEGGSYAASSEVHVSAAPDWDYRVVVDIDENRRELPNSYVDECLWIGEDQLLFTVELWPEPSSYGIAVVGVDGTGFRQLTELPNRLHPSSMFRLDDTRAIFNVFDQSTSSYEAPQFLDLSDGTTRPILLKGDFVVAVEMFPTQ